jgi:hypothetical protein
MLLIILCSASLIAGLFIQKNWRYETFGIVLTVLGAIVLFICVLCIPLNRYFVKKDIERVKAFKATLSESRSSGEFKAERVAFLSQIAHWNEKIAACKYDNTHGFDLWIPDEIDQIELIK